MKQRALILAAVVVACVVPMFGAQQTAAEQPPEPNSGVVRTWNAIASDAIFNATNAAVPGAGQTPPVGTTHMAMVQIAVYDAVNSILGGHQPYLHGLPPAAPGASVDAAVATAAHDVLVGLGIAPVPSLPGPVITRINLLYGDALLAIPDGPAEEGGIAAGAAAAAAMLAERTGDGRFVPDPFTTGTAPGEWQTIPPANVNDPFAWVRNVRPFVLGSAADVRTNGPLDVSSRAYARDYDEVKNIGAVGSPRTAEQQATADFFTVNPVVTYNRAFREIAAAQQLTLADEARLFAMLNTAGADALIGCWDDKEYWHYWRPITAIRNGDQDGNARTEGDANWTPYFATPPYPDHPSGYNCVTGAFMNMGRLFFDSNAIDFRLVRPTASGDVVRNYRHFTDVPRDTIDARVWLGIHFRTADEQGVKLGKDVAIIVDSQAFLPLG
jgi:hypothetical protein